MTLISNNLKYHNCPLCGDKDIKKTGNISYLKPLYFSTTPIELETMPSLYKCNHCDSGFVQNVIPEEKAMSLYAGGSSNERWKAVDLRKSKLPEVINALQRIFIPNSHVLDIGCNTGELLDLAKENACITYGNEPSLESQQVLIKKGHKVCATLAGVEDESMDIITAFDLVEHIYNVTKFLELCKLKLKKGGRMVIFTGNIHSKSARWAGSNWWYLKYPEHVIFPSISFLESTGFKLEEKIDTYASVGYKRSRFSSIKALIRGKITFNYKGLPSWGSDHYISILLKN